MSFLNQIWNASRNQGAVLGVVVLLLIAIGSCGFPSQSDRKLFEAINDGDYAQVQQLISDGAHINDLVTEKGEHTTPLIVSISAGELEIMDFLIKNGADVNRRAESGATPLQEAALSNQPDAVVQLMKHGARLSLSDDFKVTFYSVINRPDYKRVRDLLVDEKIISGRR